MTVKHQVRLVDLDDPTHVVHAEVVGRHGKVATVRHNLWRPGTWPVGARGKGYWEGKFDAQTGMPLYDRAAFRVHEDDVWMLRGGS